jgi:hypothetical protein
MVGLSLSVNGFYQKSLYRLRKKPGIKTDMDLHEYLPGLG